MNWNEEKEGKLESSFKFSSRRDLAKKFQTSEKKIQEKLEELGFRTIESYTETQDDSSTKDLSYQISDMERRKLQGIFGEKIAVFVKGKIERFLEASLPEEWSLHKGIKLTTSESTNKKSLWFGERNTLEKGIDISDFTVRHRNLSEEEIIEKVRKRHFFCQEQLFRKFEEHRIPNIDQVYYAVKKTGETQEKQYHVINSKASSFSRQEKQKIDLQEVEDFKVIGVEIKTTENRAENLLSSLQREIRNKARKSPYLDLYILKVEYSEENKDIPETVDIRIEKVD